MLEKVPKPSILYRGDFQGYKNWRSLAIDITGHVAITQCIDGNYQVIALFYHGNGN